MKKLSTFILILTLIVFISCDERSDEYVAPGPGVKVDIPSLSGAQVQNGQLIVKFKNEPSLMEVATRSRQVAIHGMERVFPSAGRFEERTRAAGLHLWYVVKYDETVSVTRAAEAFSLFDNIQIIEPVILVKKNTSATFRPISGQDIAEIKNVATQSHFNDPFLPYQWNYNNTGTINYTAKGADIRLFDAWKITAGHPDVIVAVVDGGIDYAHVDLAANVWVNEAELNGADNIDDDGNGYKDDIYGYNFVTGKAVEPTLHGTHVAGTISAVNNNSIGVGGIAGGDGTAGSGVRLISCQIFVDNEQGEKSSTNYYTAAAIKYGADNGAVISQNSWGFDLGTASSTPAVIKEAIDYFINNAGLDEFGNQEGPMKGGLVVFAAGNDHTSLPSYPAFDKNVVSVAAMAPDYKKANYSNFSSTVDIIAPGGDLSYDPANERTGVLSTGSGWNGTHVITNSYYYMEGTSMACPHVSGVAALLISHYGVGNPGFTPARLKEMLYGSTYNIYGYNPIYQNQLGVGALDAKAALSATGGEAAPPVLLKSIANFALTQIGESQTIVLSDYFAPSAKEELIYSVSLSTPDIAFVELAGGLLKISSTAYGRTNVTVTAIGVDELKTSITFLFSCYSKSVIPRDERPSSGLWVDVGDGQLQ